MKKRWIVTLVIVVVGALILIVTTRDSQTMPSFESVTVSRGNVVNEVSVTGHIRPTSRVDLAFTISGRVAEVILSEGSHVLAGEPIVRLESNVLQSQLHEAEARLSRELAIERDLLAPLRSEEQAIKDANAISAERLLEKAELSARAALSRAYTYTDDAVQEEVDELFTGTEGTSQKFGIEFTYGTTKYIITADAQTRSALTTAREDVSRALTQLRELSNETTRDVRELLPEALTHIITIETFLNNVAETVNRYIPTDTGAQTVYESYQTTVASARTAVSSARSDIVAAQKEYESAHAAYIQALNDLHLAEAGASEGSIAVQAAAVMLAQQGVQSARAQLSHATIVAPFTGVIGLLDVTQGEVISAQQSIGNFIGDGGVELEVYVSEADIADIELGDTAHVTFDAFDKSQVFTATVVRMAIGETLREGVPAYKTVLHITSNSQNASRMLSGMTADIDILTDAREDVLLVPTRSILQTPGRTFVRIWDGNEVVERDVDAGLKGSDGMTEIVSGLREGEEIILFLDEA